MLKGALIRPYKAGSIIYFEGDRGEDVYVLQNGGVCLLSSTLDGKEEVRENVKKGEFFGVKSSLGHFPREETAQVLIDSVVLVFNLKAFEQLCLKNVRLVLQVLKVLSSQLRKVHKQVREQLGESETLEQSVEFLRVGEYYFKAGRKAEANHVFKIFLENHKDSSAYERAVRLNEALDAGASYPEDIEPLSEGSEGTFSDVANISDITIGNISDPETPQDTLATETTASDILYEGMNLLSQENIDGAIEKFKEVLKWKSFANSKEAASLEKAYYEICRCYLKKKDIKNTISCATEFIKRYPRSESLKNSLVILAQAFEMKRDVKRAVVFYKKVVSLPPKDKVSSSAAKKIEQLLSKK